MKKHLLSTSAIALGVAMAAPAAAQEWDVSFGGYMSQHVGYANTYGTAISGTDQDGVGFLSNTEIIFTPSITLDNGLTFGVNVQLEGENQTGPTQIDETYMTISSDTLGQIIIGSENSAGYKSMVGAPTVTTMYINSPSISAFIPFSAAYNGGFRQAGLSSYTEVAGNNDVQRLTYFTPSFNGLTVGISYAPTASPNARNSYGLDRNLVVNDIFDIGANYSQTFGTTSVTLSARYGTGNAGTIGYNGSDPSTWGIGAQFGFGAFTVGGSYAENDNGLSGLGNSNGWSLGATYDIAGPWAIEAVTYQGEARTLAATGGDYGRYEAYRIGGSRDLGPGVSWDVYLAYVASDDGNSGFLAGTALDNQNVKGTLIGTGINLSF